MYFFACNVLMSWFLCLFFFFFKVLGAYPCIRFFCTCYIADRACCRRRVSTCVLIFLQEISCRRTRFSRSYDPRSTSSEIHSSHEFAFQNKDDLVRDTISTGPTVRYTHALPPLSSSTSSHTRHLWDFFFFFLSICQTTFSLSLLFFSLLLTTFDSIITPANDFYNLLVTSCSSSTFFSRV